MNHKLVKENCDVISASPSSVDSLRLFIAREKHSEGGYTLVALLALMTIFAILAMAVAPSIQQQNMRAREAEAISRGEEVAEAIRLYVFYHPNALPTSMDQLREGISRGTKKIQILRPEAARDPITGLEWRRIRQTDAAIVSFERDILNYAGTQPPLSAQTMLQVPKVANLLNIGSKDDSTATAADDNLSDTDGPFIGVASRDSRASVITYYGIDHHDGWIFTPAINPRCDRSPTSCE